MRDGVGMPKGSNVAVPWAPARTGMNVAHVKKMISGVRQILKLTCSEYSCRNYVSSSKKP